MKESIIERFKASIVFIMKKEVLDELPAAPRDQRRISVFARLLEAETLPFDGEVSGERLPRRSSGLFASEVLPMDENPAPRDGRRSLINLLFSGESLPIDPVPGPGAPRRGAGR